MHRRRLPWAHVLAAFTAPRRAMSTLIFVKLSTSGSRSFDLRELTLVEGEIHKVKFLTRSEQFEGAVRTAPGKRLAMGQKSRAKRERSSDRAAQSKKRSGLPRVEVSSKALSTEDLHAEFPELSKLKPDLQVSAECLPVDLPAVSLQLAMFGKPIFDSLRPRNSAGLQLCAHIAMLFWNSTRLPPGELKDLAETALEEHRGVLAQGLFKEMAKQSKRFESDPRVIVDVKVIQEPLGFRIQAVSVFLGEESS